MGFILGGICYWVNCDSFYDIRNLPFAVVDYSIFNSVGQTVASGSSSGTIPVTSLEQGLYFLQIKREEGRQTVKFVVK